MQDLISIIVPIYNVKDYLERCVQSIIAQTYAHLEIILVDDGSTDSSGEVAERLKLKDERIVLVHKMNGGLSSARNAGIDIAKGEYLVFVDSDDWLHPEYVEQFYAEAKTFGCKMVIGGFEKCADVKEYATFTNSFEHVSMDNAIPRMLQGEWISAWAKLYHRSLFDNVRFPVGRNNEDYAILIYLFEQCEFVSYTKDVVYYYFMREGSITHSTLNPYSFDEFQNGIEIYNYCLQKYPQWSGLALFNLTASIIKLTGACMQEGKCMDKYEEIKRYTIAYKKEILQNPSLPNKYKPFIQSMLMGRIAHKTWLNIYGWYKRE